MKANTRFFGEVEIEDEKIIVIENGMIGFPQLQKFALIFNEEKGKEAKIMWLQSMDEPTMAFPVMRPEMVMENYNPTVNDELFETLGEMTPEDTYVLATVTVPKNVKEASINLKAPIVVNTATMKGCQIIVEDDYPVKYRIHQNEKAGE